MGVEVITLLFFGFLAATLGVSLPGLLNMTAVKIAKEEGGRQAFHYILGALAVIFIQTFVAIFFSKLIDSSPGITEALHEIGLAIFAILTIYFLFFAKKKEKKKADNLEKRKSPFIYGVFLASINVFLIPYYVFLSITLATYDFPIFDILCTTFFSLGVVLGSGMMFYIYVSLFKKPSREDAFILRNINYVIGTITGVICLITIYKLLK